ncbi:MAG TPA: glycosyltransferase family 39 protein [Candidatus Dormibacteraeota bacterium]|nr:glycosyltransferase family 39 protein [Candidatus Dormibacteraeota bacterium]
MRFRYPNVCYGLIAYIASLLGTLLLANELARPWAVFMLISAAALGVITWGRQEWIPAFPLRYSINAISGFNRSRLFYLLGVISAILVGLGADLRYLAAPNDTFGLAGLLWLASIGLLLCAAFVGSQSASYGTNDPHLTPWTNWEIVILAALTLVALFTRVWDLTGFPDNIYPDEIMTGTIATQSYITGTGSIPSIFSTLWHGIDLPALWFWIVSRFLKVGGNTLATLRLPAALFGAATVLPLYGLIRGTWGRNAAIAGTAILAFSASNIHYSRLALNNITTQFFWTACFFFLLRGIRSRRPLDWTLAGLSAGLSEYFYYGTRLLPFILILFNGYILAFNWRQARQYLSGFLLLAGSYVIGFGPLLFYFIWKLNLYFGRGASLMIWSPHIPTSFKDFPSMWKIVWPVFRENLLGISTHSSQDIIFYAPLLLPVEAALLVLGVALLLWHWRHPAAFLMLISGVGVLLIGGTLVAYPNSVPPLINHWTPAFPAFYVALAVPIGAWAASAEVELPDRRCWVLPATLAIGLSVLCWLNLSFYFHRYYANPASLRSSAYRSAQQNYEIQTAQSRYQASLGPGYHVFAIGKGSTPYDATTTPYLVANQEWTMLSNPSAELSSIPAANKGLAFLFFPRNEQYRELTHKLYPGGVDGEVTTKRGKHLFYTYVLRPRQARADP